LQIVKNQVYVAARPAVGEHLYQRPVQVCAFVFRMAGGAL
jgi:hypothetical protein